MLLAIILPLLACIRGEVLAFQIQSLPLATSYYCSNKASTFPSRRSTIPVCFAAPSEDEETNSLWNPQGKQQPPQQYSRDIMLREEADSPFRKVRFFFYISCLGGAFTSLALSGARVVAGLNGINVDMMEESLTNVVVDAGAIALLAVLYQRDLKAEDSRLKRASKGAELAKLAIRGSPKLLEINMDEDNDKSAALRSMYRRAKAIEALEGNKKKASAGSKDSVSASKSVTIPLAAFRRGRGIEKRVVIAAAGRDTITRVLETVTSNSALSKAIGYNDLLVVPVILPQCEAPLGLDKDILEQEWIALPAGPGMGGDWKAVLEDEAAQASSQGVDVVKDGFCVVLKKNGRVGTRTKGIYLENMVGDVLQRKEMGMDVTNI
jgi:hypothetical protein